MKTRFILIQTSHAGNVGAVARAMKVMGFDDLVLVAPRWPDVLTRDEAIERASGAHDVLAKARSVATLDEALDGMSHLCATAMTPRDFGPPTVAPRPHFERLLGRPGGPLVSALAPVMLAGEGTPIDALGEADAAAGDAARPDAPEGVAFLFGSERYGMRNDDVYRCHVCLSIPTHPDYGSLNLAAAVQLIAYEWRQALGGFGVPGLQAADSSAAGRTAEAPRQADAAQVAGMLQHLEAALVAVDFLDPAAPKKLMPRLNQLFNRAQPTPEDIHILRGIAKAMLRQAAQVGAQRAEAPADAQTNRSTHG
ncbi:rRNA methyltransferase [Comamonas serinivorans]|uniref:rRNA methyltransferase n=1 Tax=Comamonas serinivorans TaxID=1082851 RepID=A0A1Y0EMD9_9BURK|nr:RNA methyltransferase [Comamonas serinivorans]ARU04793.1 rRNA methyltransferase [Comamonas serinivorans]